jgi:hypothetical protein
MTYSDEFVVRTQNIEQVGMLLDFFDRFATSTPCWQESICICGAPSKGGVCSDLDCAAGGAA